MKQLGIWMAAALVVLAAACKKDVDSEAQPVNLSVKVYFNTTDSTLGLSKVGALVEINNLTSGTTVEATTNAEGIASFASIPPGNYTITGSITITAATYSTASGTVVSEDVVYNGNITGQSVVGTTLEVALPLTAGRIGSWVFKQVYYAGSNTSQGAGFRDQFFEIYNNSNEVMYADSLYFAQLIGSNSTANNTATKGYLSTNQYDWSQSVGITGTNPNDNYVYARSVFMVPGTGTQYPVQPGSSIVIAQTGLNHTASYTMNDGLVQTVTNPALTIDLSGADFETYLVDYKRSTYTGAGTFDPYKWDVDNPAVKNMDVFYLATGNEMILDNLGREALIIYQPQSVNPRSYPSFPLPTVTTVTTSTVLYQQIPISVVIDAVELQTVTESKRVPKRLPNSLDAGPTNVTGGEYSSQSLVRKTKRTVNGRRILQDTNNSANDFVTKTKADPSKTAASFAE